MSTELESPPEVENEDLAATISRRIAESKDEHAPEVADETQEAEPTEPPAMPDDDLSAPPEQPEEEPTQQQVATALSKLREEQGIDLSHKFQSDYDLASSYVQLEKRLGERDEDANAWREFAKDPQRYLAYFTPPAQQEPEPTSQSDVPEWNQEWLQQVHEVDGEYKPLPGAEPDVVNKILRAHRYVQKKQFEHFLNPQPTEQPAIDPEQIDQIVQQRVNEELSAYSHQAEDMNDARTIIESSKTWMFEDPENPDIRSRTLTNRGKAYSKYMNQAYASGMTSAKQVDQWAREQMELAAYRANRQARPAKTQTRSAAEPAIEDSGPKYDTNQPLQANIMARLKAAGLKPR
jgi:hypothetical protein